MDVPVVKVAQAIDKLLAPHGAKGYLPRLFFVAEIFTGTPAKVVYVETAITKLDWFILDLKSCECRRARNRTETVRGPLSFSCFLSVMRKLTAVFRPALVVTIIHASNVGTEASNGLRSRLHHCLVLSIDRADASSVPACTTRVREIHVRTSSGRANTKAQLLQRLCFSSVFCQ